MELELVYLKNQTSCIHNLHLEKRLDHTGISKLGRDPL